MYTLLSFFFLIAATTGGATPADTVYVLPDLTVTATRLERSAFEATARIDVIDGQEVWRSGGRNLADALERGSGAFIRRYGPGGLASISLRGTGASQTSILLDGRRLSDPQLGQIDLSLLPAAMLDQVEVMNGAASPFFGADGIGGAVHIRTSQPGEMPRAQVSATAGAFGAREAAVSVSGGDGPLSVFFSAESERAENDYPYFSRALQRDLRLDGADRRRSSVYGSARYQGSTSDLRVALLASDAERGLASASATSKGERQWDESARLWADGTFEIAGTSVKLGGLHQRSTLRYLNPQQDLDQIGLTSVTTLDAELMRSLPGTWTGIAGGEVSAAQADHPQLAIGALEHRAAAFLQTTGEIGPVLVDAAARGDVYRDRKASVFRYVTVNPRIGLSLSLTDVMRIRASAARGFRPPTFNDRFWTPGGNPHLRPEHGWSADAGWVLRTPSISADLSGFIVDTRDQIVWLPVRGDIWSPENISHTRSLGIEAALRHRAIFGGIHSDVGLRYTLTHARDRSDVTSATFGQPLRYVPRDVGRFSAILSRNGIETELNVSYTGHRYINEDASEWLDPFIGVSLRFAYAHPIRAGVIRAGIHIENAFDADYSVVAGHPMPPRHARLSLSIETNSR